MYRITINDNDFTFLMDRCMDYIDKVYVDCKKHPENYPSQGEKLIEELVHEFMDAAHIDSEIKKYVFDNLKIENVSEFKHEFENSECFYFYGNYHILR